MNWGLRLVLLIMGVSSICIGGTVTPLLWNNPLALCPPYPPEYNFHCIPSIGYPEIPSWLWTFLLIPVGILMLVGMGADIIVQRRIRLHRKHFVKEKTLMLCDGNNGEHAPHWTEWGTYEDGYPVYECDPEWKRIS